MADNFFGITDTGRQRSNNEDTFVAQPSANGKHTIAAVIDGVGGYAGGEVAASIARDTIAQELDNITSNVPDALIHAVARANDNIIAEKQKSSSHDAMACVCTVVVALPEKNEVYFAHVGDTRLYLFRDGTLIKLTTDHSFVGFLEESGRLTEAEAMRHPKRNEINKALGFEPDIADKSNYIETGTSPFLPGDILLLCSDGLTDMIKRQDIISILQQASSLIESGRNLIDMANHNGGMDNVTVVLVSNDRSPAAHTAIKPTAKKKDQPDKVNTAQPTEPVNSPVVLNNDVPEAKRKKSSGWVIIVLLVVLAGAAFAYYQYKQKNGRQTMAPLAAQTSNAQSTPTVSAEQAMLQQMLDSLKTDTLVLSDSVFKKPIAISKAIQINRDTLLVKTLGSITLVADSGFEGPALALSSNAKLIALSHINLSGFNTAITAFNNALALKAVAFNNCDIPVQIALTAANNTPVTGWLPNNILKQDTSSQKTTQHTTQK